MSSADASRKPRILFVCARNSCRSPTAEAIARALGRDAVEVASAGTTPRGRIDPMALYVMRRHGFLGSGLRSKVLTERAARRADRIVLLATEDERPGPLPCPEKVEVWRIEDPLGWPVDVYEDAAVEIERRVRFMLATLRAQLAASASVQDPPALVA